MSTPTLTSVAELIPASYNPRITDPERLARLATSIRKLGWLLPTYATESGELLSGHQRSLVAKQLGYERVPCVRMPDMDEVKRKAINIMFNRSTNDMEATTDTRNLKRELLLKDLAEMAAHMPDRHDHFPCLGATEEPIEPYLKINHDRFIVYALNVARALWSDFRLKMPIVVDEQGVVVNGIGRLEAAAERGEKTAMFVHITNQEAALARICLNLISMDFALGDKYRDFLRYNAFRRTAQDGSATATIEEKGYMRIGWAFIFLFGSVSGMDYDLYVPSIAKAWKARYGASVVDFGGGRGNDTKILREIGVRVSFFEPFFTFPNENRVDIETSRKVADAFLADVAAGVQYSSLFLSAVLNSVPFMEDRRMIVAILAALCGRTSTVYALTHGDRCPHLTNITTERIASQASSQKFLLDYEPNTTIGDLTMNPKVQKYHTPAELQTLFGEFFEQVTIGEYYGHELGVIARKAKPVQPALLRAALNYEFNVPYPGGESMNRHEQACAAFGKRLKISLL